MRHFSLNFRRAHIFHIFCSQAVTLDAATKRKYLEHYFRKCLRIKGVQGAIVFNSEGVPKHSTFEHCETIRSIGLFDDLILKVNIAIHMTQPDDQFVSIRLRTHKFEIFISKDLDDIYFVIFQNAKGKCKLLHIPTQIASLNCIGAAKRFLPYISVERNTSTYFQTKSTIRVSLSNKVQHKLCYSLKLKRDWLLFALQHQKF